MVEIKEKLTDKEIEHYYERIIVRSIFREQEGDKKIFEWMVCCKLCQVELFPYVKDMEKEKVDHNLGLHNCKGDITK